MGNAFSAEVSPAGSTLRNEDSGRRILAAYTCRVPSQALLRSLGFMYDGIKGFRRVLNGEAPFHYTIEKE